MRFALGIRNMRQRPRLAHVTCLLGQRTPAYKRAREIELIQRQLQLL